ncbi:MAG: hypothetical protein EOP56_17700 [Sphingobacteriales bacterium]|nr:MAG: hypothetical protein EOP56_17700 [Sphingobacteriales bacterium]
MDQAVKSIFREVLRDEFKERNVPVLFSDPMYDGRYAVIEIEKVIFKLAWSSDLLMPSLCRIDTNIYAIGIDEHFVIIDVAHNKILLNLDVFSNFVETTLSQNYAFVIAEIALYKIDLLTFEVVDEVCGLPDAFSEIVSKKGDTLKVRCLNDQIIEI